MFQYSWIMISIWELGLFYTSHIVIGLGFGFRVVQIISPVGHAYAAPSIFYGRCICSAQQNFIKTLILFLKIEIRELKFRKNTVFFVIKNTTFD